MNLTSLQRLITGCNSLAFRDIAFAVLRGRGYQKLELTDGRYDGGSDFKQFTMPPNDDVLIIQLSISKDWKSKIRKDARKVAQHYDARQMVFVSSRRIPERIFSEVKDAIYRDHGLIVTRIDAQGIASTLIDKQLVDEALEALGISKTVKRAHTHKPTNFKAVAASSFSLFGQEPSEFRGLIIQSALLSVCLKHSEGVHRDDLEEQAASLTDQVPNVV